VKTKPRGRIFFKGSISVIQNIIFTIIQHHSISQDDKLLIDSQMKKEEKMREK